MSINEKEVEESGRVIHALLEQIDRLKTDLEPVDLFQFALQRQAIPEHWSRTVRNRVSGAPDV